jgi:uncharacterized protein (TIGR02001 family)
VPLLAVAPPPDVPAAATIDAYAAIATQYVYRGVALRDRPTPTFALSASAAGGWFVDLWSAPVDVESADAYDESQRAWDVEASAGYGDQLGGQWQWSLAAARIIDIGGGNSVPNDYTEWRANLFWRDVAQAQFAYAPDYQQRGWSSWNAEFGITRALTQAFGAELGIGRSHGTAHADTAYSYGWLGVNGFWLHTQWNLRWSDSQHGARYVLDEDRAGSRFVLSLSWGLHILPR